MSESKIERASRIKALMAEHRLTAQWLMLRLSQDHNIETDKYTLSKILSGALLGGEKPEQIISASEKILERYKDLYKKEVS